MAILRSWRHLVALCVVAATAAMVAAAPAQAATYTVMNTNDSGADSLRQAILDANAAAGADTINFAVTGTITLTSGQLTVTDNLTIDGPGAVELTISGNNTSRVMAVSAGVTLNLSDVRIADGTGTGLTFGAGIFSNGTLIVASTTFSENVTNVDGGAIFNGGTLTVAGSTFSGNRARFFGGGTVNYGTATVIESSFIRNFGDLGGGIANRDAVLTVTNSTFFENSAGRGGGISNDALFTASTVTNSTFYRNTAGLSGGGIDNNSGELAITNSTFSENLAGEGTGAINNSLSFPTLTLRNTIVANSSSAGNCGAAINDGGGNLQYPGTDCGPTITSADPLLDPAGLQDNGGPTETIALQPGSPAVDAAVDANCPASDQRGVARPQGAHCDIGAFELVQTVHVGIDIKPGSFPNSINTSSKAIIPVAVLGASTFDASTVDPSTVCFGDAEDAGQRDCTVARGTKLKDVNGDGIRDLVLHFNTEQTGIDPGDTQACLTGELFDTTQIEGCDSIKAK